MLEQGQEVGSNGVATYVDPALYPLVWGRSWVLLTEAKSLAKAMSRVFSDETGPHRRPNAVSQSRRSAQVRLRCGSGGLPTRSPELTDLAPVTQDRLIYQP